MKKKVVYYFQMLFVDKQSTCEYSQATMFFPRLNVGDISSLNATISEQEVKQSIFSIGGMKAPRPNGFLAIFFQKFWSTCKYGLVSGCFLKECA